MAAALHLIDIHGRLDRRRSWEMSPNGAGHGIPSPWAGPAADSVLEPELYPEVNFGQFLKAGNDESGVMSST